MSHRAGLVGFDLRHDPEKPARTLMRGVKRFSERTMPRQVSAEHAEDDGADEGKRDIRGHDTQPDGHGKLPLHVTARI